MAITFERASALKKDLEPKYQQRHSDFKTLRDFWWGRHWDAVDSSSHGINSLFQDIRGPKADAGPDIRLVHNIIKEVCDKYQSFLSPVPMIRVPADSDSKRAREQATTRERYLYGCWGENTAAKVLNRMAWYLPLMGDCFLGIWPDFERNVPRMLVRSPERAFPIPDTEGDIGALIFSWEVPESIAKRDYPGWTPQERKGGIFRRKGSTEAMVEIVEYSDKKEFVRWIDGERVNGVEHNFGFNLFDQVPFIYVPDEPWNHGAVEQAVNLNLAEDALRSLLFQAVLENVFPKLILEDPYKFPEQMDDGPGAVIGVNQGGKAYYLTPPVQSLPVQVGFMGDNERAIKQSTSMPDVNFGNINASIITGKAINELQGAGTGSLVEMVQGTGIGSALSNWNSKAIIIAQRMFKEDRIYLEGFFNESHFDINPKAFTFSKKGSEIVGSPRNEVVFSPYLNAHEKLVMALQAMGGGLVSKQHSRDQIGVPDSAAMEEEIFQERVDEAVLSSIEQALLAAGASVEDAMAASAEAEAYLAGQPFNGTLGPAPALPNQAAGAGGFPAGPLAAGAPGQAFAPALQLPPGSPVPQSAPTPAPAQGQGITLDEAIQAFQSVQGVSGRVFLVGEIVQAGQTQDDIEVAITNPADRQVLIDGLPQYAGLLHFHSVQAEPGEPHVEVTPGAEPVQGEQAPDLSFIQ